jgi:predicted dehydrogenase
MDKGNLSRRGFMQRSLAAMAAAGLPAWYARQVFAFDEAKKPADDLIRMGAIGIGGSPRRGKDIMRDALGKANVEYIALCDVDSRHRDQGVNEIKKAAQDFKKPAPELKTYADFRELLDNKDINAVTIAVPDHWHAIIAMDALKKGKDVYLEKPLTLTIAEGQALAALAKKSGRIFQTGSQQRSDFGGKFRLAVDLVRNGRIGKVKTIETRIGGLDKNKTGPFKKETPPKELDWDFWQGQTGPVDYIPQRCHYEFRWWYEYSGGKMTDWGAHHLDVAQWALDMDNSGPTAVEGTGEANKNADCYNVHSDFKVNYTYANGANVVCTAGGENGVKFIGEDGKWIFVSRGALNASDEKIIKEPIPEGSSKVYLSTNHMQNFLDGVRTRKACICPAEVGFRSVTVCHIGVIALRTGKKLKWDPVKQKFDDDEANKMLSREMRKPWKLDV